MDQKASVPEKTLKNRIGLIDFAVFAIVLTIFSHSVYQLFYDWESLPLSSIASLNDADKNTSARSLASRTPTFASIEFDCQSAQNQTTQSSKVRLSGPLCGISLSEREETQKKILLRTEVVNQTNQAKATVFTDSANQRFLTDYIPVQVGENQVSLKFVFDNGKTLQKELLILRN